MQEIRRVEEANKQVQQAYLVYLRKMVAVAFDEAGPREENEKAHLEDERLRTKSNLRSARGPDGTKV